ncbi:translation initiation factor IF-2-like [Sorex araneus]|uniref:translation initiation factor IF-2-like n=1 Tax=Sorex araneus TaxID=42254 RepID=UPI002433879C|nr:translation initiation factor IF-2-like [Sorex araneus]
MRSLPTDGGGDGGEPHSGAASPQLRRAAHYPSQAAKGREAPSHPEISESFPKTQPPRFQIAPRPGTAAPPPTPQPPAFDRRPGSAATAQGAQAQRAGQPGQRAPQIDRRPRVGGAKQTGLRGAAPRHRGTIVRPAALTSVGERAPGRAVWRGRPCGERRGGQRQARPPGPRGSPARRPVRGSARPSAWPPPPPGPAEQPALGGSWGQVNIFPQLPARRSAPRGRREEGGCSEARARAHPQTGRSPPPTHPRQDQTAIYKNTQGSKRGEAQDRGGSPDEGRRLGSPLEAAGAGGGRAGAGPTQFVRETPQPAEGAGRPGIPGCAPTLRPHISGLPAQAERPPLPHAGQAGGRRGLGGLRAAGRCTEEPRRARQRRGAARPTIPRNSPSVFGSCVVHKEPEEKKSPAKVDGVCMHLFCYTWPPAPMWKPLWYSWLRTSKKGRCACDISPPIYIKLQCCVDTGSHNIFG